MLTVNIRFRPSRSPKRNQYAAERSNEIAYGEHAERLNLAKPLRGLGGKKQLPHCLREENEDNEIVKLQNSAEAGQCEGFVVAGGQQASGERIKIDYATKACGRIHSVGLSDNAGYNGDLS